MARIVSSSMLPTTASRRGAQLWISNSSDSEHKLNASRAGFHSTATLHLLAGALPSPEVHTGLFLPLAQGAQPTVSLVG
jgi:hypothetical protein